METPEQIEVRGKAELVLTWEDGTRMVIPAAVARAGCTCASCRNDPASALRRANPLVPVTIESASLVGAYAINLVFGPDGHRTGIYDWDTLHRLGTGTSAQGDEPESG